MQGIFIRAQRDFSDGGGDVLKVASCGYRYPGADRWAFRNMDLEVGRGEIIFVRGRNGSGKTTLLKVICGILDPTAGRVVMDNGACPIYMDQSADQMLAFDLTVQEQLSAFRKPSAAATQFRDHLREFGIDLEARLNEFVGHLSGGQRQIIALLATIGSGANLLCLDEFLSALDTRSVEVATKLIDAAVQSGAISVMAVSHSPVSLRFDREVYLDASQHTLAN